MIYDVLATMKTVLEDSSTGLNAQIAVVNTAKGTSVPTVKEFEFEDFKLPSQFLRWPALQAVWAHSPDLVPQSQSKWRGTHRFEWQYWTGPDTRASGGLQTDIAITAHALRTVAELLPGNGTVVEVENLGIFVTGVEAAGKKYTVMVLSFDLLEIDENP